MRRRDWSSTWQAALSAVSLLFPNVFPAVAQSASSMTAIVPPSKEWFTTADGAKLAFVREQAAIPKNCVVFLPGEYGSFYQYKEFFGELKALHLSVFALDPRGFGGSPALLSALPYRVHISDPDIYVRDLVEFTRAIVAPACAAKEIYLVGHSAGGAIALAAALGDELRVAGVALVSPLLGFRWRYAGTLERWLLRSGSASGAAIYPLPFKQRFGSFEANQWTQSRPRHMLRSVESRRFPEFSRDSTSKGWVLAMHRFQSALWDSHRVDRSRLPVLMLQAGNDRAVSNATMDAFCQRLEGCKTVAIAGAKHDLLLEVDGVRRRAIDAIVAFLFPPAVR